MREYPVIHDGRVVGVHKDYGRCPHRYQEAPLAGVPPLCSCGCGLYAVGACSMCLSPLAGIHVGKTLPLYCAGCQVKADAALLAQATADAQAEKLRQIESTRVSVAKLVTISDPFERVLVAIHACRPVYMVHTSERGVEIDVNQAALQACPQISPEAGPQGAPLFCDSTTLGDFSAWVRRRFTAAGLSPNGNHTERRSRTPLFRRPITEAIRIPAWVFRGGSTERHFYDGYCYYDSKFRILSGPIEGGSTKVATDGTRYDGILNAVGAYLIADVLGLGHPSDPPAEGSIVSLGLLEEARKSFELRL